MITGLKLVEGSSEMELYDRDDLRVTGLNIPFPEVRAVAEDRTDADGQDDSTAHFGARAVGITLRLLEQSSAVLDELAAYLHPRSRPYLVVADDDWAADRRLRLRTAQFGSPVDIPLYPYARDVQAQWVAPDGAWEDVVETEFTATADSGTLVGRTYPLITPRTYPATAAAGLTNHVNPGTWAHYKVKLYGPCVGPRWSNETTGETYRFTSSLVVAAGDYIEIDTKERTALYVSDPDASRLNFLDYAVSTWWQLAPGMNAVRYHPISGVGAGAIAVVTYRPTRLS